MKKSSKVMLSCMFFSIAAPSPSYAWRGGGGSRGASTATIGIAAVITAPIWLPIFGIYWLGKKISHLGHGTPHRENGFIVDREVPHYSLEATRDHIRSFYSEVSGKIDAISSTEPHFVEVASFLREYVKAQEHHMDPGTFLCKFRSTLLAHLPENSLDPKELVRLFEEYETTSIVPASFISSAHEHLGLLDEDAQKIFGILYTTTLEMGIPISEMPSVERAT